MDWLKSKTFLVAVGIIALVGVYLLSKTLGFHLVSTSPNSGQKGAAIDQSITLTFNKPLGETNNVKVLVNDITVDNFSVEDKVFTINYPLSPFTEYSVSTTGIVSSRGQKIDLIAFKFVTGDLPAAAKKIKEDFIKSLPVLKDNFSIDYTVTNQTVNVEILAEPVDKTKQEALDFLKKYYVSEATDNISFFVIPSVSGQAGP